MERRRWWWGTGKGRHDGGKGGEGLGSRGGENQYSRGRLCALGLSKRVRCSLQKKPHSTNVG